MAVRASNLVLRFATAGVGIPVILLLLYPAPPWAFYLLVLAASLVGAREFFAMTHSDDVPAQWVGVVISGAASLAIYLFPADSRVLVTLLVAVPALGPACTLARVGAMETAALRACALGFGPLFVAVPLTLLAVMKKTLGEAGPGSVVLALGLAWMGDSVAYFTGRFLGRHKLYEAVSPKKTVEGAVGGLVGSIAWAAIGSASFLRGFLPLQHAVLLALPAAVLGQTGDLAESLLKRSTGVKDSGVIVPGHGGILDRVDAVIMTTAVVFSYILWEELMPIPTPPPSRSHFPTAKEFDFYKVIQEYLERATKVAKIEPYVHTILSQPKNEIIVNFPVRLDGGEIRLFKGYRVQHNNLLGPFKGGMRYHPQVALDDVKALAAMMTWKSALMRLPFGGGKGGIKFDPHSVSKQELQRITRRFTHALGENIGPEYDIPAPDVGTNGQIMAWMMDTYSNMVGSAQKQMVKGVVTGKPVASGGTLGRQKATGQGIVFCLLEWAKDRAFNLEGSTMLVQGFGNVGSHTAVILAKLGVSTIAVGDHTGYMYNPEGLNAHKLQDYVEAHGTIAGYPGGKPITREEFFATKADIFAPCALENQIGEAEAKALDVKLVAEGANGPSAPTGERILLDKGVDILPDVLANSGGVTVSYYEWVQNKRSETWTEDEVDARLEIAMKRAYREVSDFARQKKCDMRVAAYAIALQRIEAVYKEREIFP